MGIKSVLFDKLIMGALFLYPPVIQNDYPVGILDCFEPMGNGNDGASFNQRVDGFLHLHFIFWVERSGRFIKQDDLCVFQHGTGYGYALLLASGQGTASFANYRVVALWQAHDEVVATGFLGGSNDFLVCRVCFAETDVVAYRVLKQIDVLEHHRDVAHQTFGGYFVHRNAAKGNITVEMEDYGNMEKAGPIGTSLPRNDRQTTTGPGDIILYQGKYLVIYYDTNSWNFTRLGKIDNVTQAVLKSALGEGGVRVTLSLE